ncbi:Fic family protein [Lactobacillus helveticus]|uniref:Fic family protein n=1 Tax=Lactobacillus helveticus TaxID=1587 RepID=UPI002E2BCF42|nr:Fic family protein [Lactobacillus helveticus]
MEDLKKVHQIIFSPLYEWAGHYRKNDFRKGNTLFFPRERFDYAEEDINEVISNLPKKGLLSAENYASLIDKINFFHPFREGNGRSTRTFLQLFALEHGQAIDYPLSNDAIVAENEADVAQIASLIKIEAVAE